jgi:hypothetical protein
LIKSLNFENKNSFEIDVVKNSDFNESENKEFPNGFIYFPFFIEYYSNREFETTDIFNTIIILKKLW